MSTDGIPAAIGSRVIVADPDGLNGVRYDAFELEETGQLAIGVPGEQRSLEGLAAAGKPAPVAHELREPDEPVKNSKKPACGVCGKTLKDERWTYSRFTGKRYCLPGECKTDRKR